MTIGNHEVQAAKGLTDTQRQDIKSLEELCNRNEGITLKLNWDMLETRSPEEINDFLVYRDGELAGFLGMYGFGSKEIELSGMVHPVYRQQGIFTALVKQAELECRNRNIPKMIYMCQRGSAAGKAFLTAWGAAFSFSEHWMERLDADCATAEAASTRTAGGEESRLSKESAIKLSKASLEDLPLLTRLASEGFSMEQEEAREYIKRTLLEINEWTYLVHAEDQPVGSLRVSSSNGEGIFIYGFSVLPEFRGRGYGRKALQAVIDRYRQKGVDRFFLEVATDNDRALGLYESVGFRSKNINDYYTVTL